MEFICPKNSVKALRILKKPGSLPVAGGTAFIGMPNAKTLVDLTGLKLAYVKEDARTIRIGATTPISELEKSHVARNFCGGILREACETLADAPLRNSITVGGNVACKHLWAHLPPVLMVLDAELLMLGKKKVSSVEEFLGKKRKDVIAEVRVSKKKNSGKGAFLRFSRTSTDYARAIAAAYAEVDGDRITSLRVAVSGALQPTRLRDLEKVLAESQISQEAIGRAVSETVQKLAISESIYFSEEYLREILGVLIKRAIFKAVGLDGGSL